MSENPFKILILDDEPEMCLSLSELLETAGYTCHYLSHPNKIMAMMRTHVYDLLIMDIKMPGTSGMDVLRELKAQNTSTAVIMMTGYPSIESAVEAMKYGAINFYTKPLPFQELLNEINHLAESKQTTPRNFVFTGLMTQNEKMRQILAEAAKVAITDAPVLIMGESGTGKEVIADLIFKKSQRHSQEFVKVNCASIPDNLLESELFGHEKGAFTDAIKRHTGKFEQAHLGTIFLDEIGDMSIKTQPKILRVLQDGKIQRVGGTQSIQTDVRIISATNKKIKELIISGEFREDLFYRLSVVTFHLPPLRERKDDLSMLIEYFIGIFNQQYGKHLEGISEETHQLFLKHHWPGNIRELRNCIERAAIFADKNEKVISKSHLPRQYQDLETTSTSDGLEELFDQLSKDKILTALKTCNGVKKKAAELLNIHRKTLYNKMKKLGIK